MSILHKSLSLYIISTILLIFFLSPIRGTQSLRKLDETVLPGLPSDPSIKCGGCSPCHPSCYQSPPPPPPPSSPPPPKKPSGSAYCPPPPAYPGGGGGFAYRTAPPGNLYPVDPQYNSGATKNFAAAPVITMFLGFGVVELLLILWS